MLCIRAPCACRRLRRRVSAGRGHDARRAVSSPDARCCKTRVSGRTASDPSGRVLPQSPPTSVGSRGPGVPARWMLRPQRLWQLHCPGVIRQLVRRNRRSDHLGGLHPTAAGVPPILCRLWLSALIHGRSATPRSVDTPQLGTGARSPGTARAPCWHGASAGSHTESPPTAPSGSASASSNTSLRISYGHRDEVISSEQSRATARVYRTAKGDFGTAPAVLPVDSARRSRVRLCAGAGRATFGRIGVGTSGGVSFV